MSFDFEYLGDKVRATEFSTEPFRHLYIERFLSDEHFQAITNSPQVALGRARNDEDLVRLLHEAGYKEIIFPGTTADVSHYIDWHKKRDPKGHTNRETCEGFGVTLRLQRYEPGSMLEAIMAYFNSERFISTLQAKFGLESEATYAEQGVQKYLDGYEISPHPDIRKKALTYMLNVNPAQNSEDLDHHTHYLRFKPERAFVSSYWRGNPDKDRCWVPWDWCETVKIQRQNNSIVIFSPNDDSLHAVRAKYDHLTAQRTQFYGNLWYRDNKTSGMPSWRDFQIGETPERTALRKKKSVTKKALKRILPAPALDLIRSIRSTN